MHSVFCPDLEIGKYRNWFGKCSVKHTRILYGVLLKSDFQYLQVSVLVRIGPQCLIIVSKKFVGA